MEKNFKTIVEALKEYDNDLSLMLNFNSETEKKLDQFGNHIEQSNKKQENM